MNNDKPPSNGYTATQAKSQQGQQVTDQQQAKWLVNGSGISQEEQAPNALAKASPDEGKVKLWEPKYSALGFIVIVLVILIIDILPRLIRSKLDAATTPKPVELNELESLLVTQLDSLSSDAS